MKPGQRMFVLCWRWRHATNDPMPPRGIEAQALEYAERVSADALERQLAGSVKTERRIREMVRKVPR